MADLATVLRQLCSFPVELERTGASGRDVLKSMGGQQVWNALQRPEAARILQEALCATPSLVEAWMGYSADKRSGGWYFMEQDGGFVVGHFPGRIRATFSDPAEACAEFIVAEIYGKF